MTIAEKIIKYMAENMGTGKKASEIAKAIGDKKETTDAEISAYSRIQEALDKEKGPGYKIKRERRGGYHYWIEKV